MVGAAGSGFGGPADPAVDSLDMRAATLGLAAQIRDAETAARSVDLGSLDGERIDCVFVAGMGGSGIGGDIAAAVLADRCSVPIVVSKNYELPRHVGERTLVVASSFSGNTEETLTVARAALAAGAPMVAMTSGGALAELASTNGRPLMTLDGSIPMPRAGIGAVTIPLVVLAERLGLVDSQHESIAEAAEQVDARLATASAGAAAEVARRIGRTVPIVYGGGQLGEVAATRWKGQFNENPKVPSWANRVPELMHNEVCGWAQHGDVTRQLITMVLLRHDFEHPQVVRRFAMLREICDEVVHEIIEIDAAGSSALAQVFDLIVMGDLVTLELAYQSHVDPGPVPILDEVKAGLARTAPA